MDNREQEQLEAITRLHPEKDLHTPPSPDWWDKCWGKWCDLWTPDRWKDWQPKYGTYVFNYILVLGLFLSSMWIGASLLDRSYITRCRQYDFYMDRPCRHDMAMRILAVQAFFEKNGRLPKELSEAQKEFDDLDQWTPAERMACRVVKRSTHLFYIPDYYPGNAALEKYTQDKNEYYNDFPIDYDFSGMPIDFLVGNYSERDVQQGIHSSTMDMPPGSWEDKQRKAYSRPAFALRSVFLKKKMEELDAVAEQVAFKNRVFIALAIIGILSLTALWKVAWRRKRWLLCILQNDGLAAFLIFFGFPVGAIYLAAFFSFHGHPRLYPERELYMHKRIEVLEQAVRDGDITPEVAAQSRIYIESLPSIREYR